MRKEFFAIQCKAHALSDVLEDAETSCPWAAQFRIAEGGVWAFESVEEAKQWDNQN